MSFGQMFFDQKRGARVELTEHLSKKFYQKKPVCINRDLTQRNFHVRIDCFRE